MNEQAAPGTAQAQEGFAAASQSLQAFATEMQRAAKESIEQSGHILEQLRNAKSLEEIASLQTTFMQQSFQRYTEFAQRIGTMMQTSQANLFKMPKF